MVRISWKINIIILTLLTVILFYQFIRSDEILINIFNLSISKLVLHYPLSNSHEKIESVVSNNTIGNSNLYPIHLAITSNQPALLELDHHDSAEINPRICSYINFLLNTYDIEYIYRYVKDTEYIICLYNLANEVVHIPNESSLAISILQRILKFTPDYKPAIKTLADYYFSINDYPNAVKFYKLLLTYEYSVENVRTLLAIYNKMGDTDEAIRVIDYALLIYPDNVWLLYEKAIIFLSTSKRQKALMIIENALDNDRDNTRLWFIACRVYQFSNELDRAIEACKKAISKPDPFIQSYSVLAEIYYQQSNLTEAHYWEMRANEHKK